MTRWRRRRDIPGQQYSFGVLASAQALGDLRALKAAGRRVSRMDPGGGCVAVVNALAREVRQG